MTINLSTPIKYIASIGVTALLVAATIYADEITTLSQTAKSGDKITHEWVNAVANAGKVNAAGMTACVDATSDNLKLYGTPTSIIQSADHSGGYSDIMTHNESTYTVDYAIYSKSNYGNEAIVAGRYMPDGSNKILVNDNPTSMKLCYGSR